ncbi:KTSC domain-containing protein [Burkholderia sp. Ac-20349]|uniref:KTSC domain-containing protein n=1 Tax=Burkholderia sp. Ac-20349 TaxID=2703893 RepID=UPI00197C774C|nr:KTSC domain-containing protein [Burkholderia sp. Ac-20349]MBN3839333.1 KTSC domain-containing protein [Burkholderia sp. Ac-20349]
MTTPPTIATTEVASSQLHAIGHDAATNTLAVRFKPRKGDDTGPLYHYSNVTPADFAALRDAESVGSHFYKAIKNSDRFPCTRIEG